MPYQDNGIVKLNFCGATVLSFNSTLGLGSQESSISIDLIEDCENGDNFYADVGAPAYFQAGVFKFGGVITSTSKTQGRSGKTINVKMSDPRQLLQNSVLIIDSYLGAPIRTTNYFNVYAFFESTVANGNCGLFGAAYSDERGMPYAKILQALTSMNPTICSPTGYNFSVDFSSLYSSGAGNLPEFFKVPGPSITILDFIQNICDTLGLEFYVNLVNNWITFGFIDLKNPPNSFSAITDAYNGRATDISYGQELRNEVTKTVIFGEKVHYLSGISVFDFYFGEEEYNGEMYPIYPAGRDECGFWIYKKIDSLNLTLDKPLPGNGPYSISELDIRAAMASFKSWSDRATYSESPGTLNAAVRANWSEAVADDKAMAKSGSAAAQGLEATAEASSRTAVDRQQGPTKSSVKLSLPSTDRDMNKVWSFVKNLGESFYGKQFICRLNQKVCVHGTENYGEKVFTDTPTSAGGWVDYGVPVLGLSEPELSFFREEDNRIGCFALFTSIGDSTYGEFNYGNNTESSGSNYSSGGT
jgi:hypothetical protein